MATPTSTPRQPYPATKSTPRSNHAATTSTSNTVYTPTPASGASPPTPAAVRAAASPMHLREKLAKSSPLVPGGFSMSRFPTSASDAGTQISANLLDGLGEKMALTPSAMGLGDLGLTTAGVNGAGALGAAIGLGVKDQEEEKRRKTDAIVSTIGTRWGRVCPEGVERAAKRVGLECLWEEGRGGAKRTLSIAGNDVLVDIVFVGDEVQGVTLELAASGTEVGKRAPEGAEVLRKDLTDDGDEYTFLDAFVSNLEKLARMDKLAEGGISCFDAIEGVRAALEKIYDWQLSNVLKNQESNSGRAMLEREVLCRRNGRPKVHTRGRVGLALQYWMDRHRVLPEDRDPEAMQTDESEPDEEDGKVYAATLECETSSSAVYPPIRSSDAWVSGTVAKEVDPQSHSLGLENPPIDWQDPPPTLKQSDPSMSINGQEALLQGEPPNARFIARFEPPIVVPLQVAIDLHQSVGTPLLQDSIQSTTYESLLFADVAPLANPTELRTNTRTVRSYHGSETAKEKRQRCTLFQTQADYGRVVDSLPFAHPRQIIEILPILRQWALLGSVLRRCFVPEQSPEKSKKSNDDEHFEMEFKLDESMTVEEELAALLASEPPAVEGRGSKVEDKVLPVDVTLATSLPTPGLEIVWPQREQLRNVSLGIGPNGVVEVYEEDQGRHSQAPKIRKTMEIAEDLGILVEWMSKET